MGGQLLRAEEKLPNQQSQIIIPSKPSITFRNVTKRSGGLIDNQINDIVQDLDGHIWVATSGGLNRYDGHRFNNVFKEFLGSTNLYDTKVVDLAVDSIGNLWILTESAIHQYNYKNDIFQTLLTKGDKIFQETLENFMNFGVKSNGELWVINDIGVLRYNYQKKTFKLYKNGSDKLTTKNARRIFINNSEDIFVGGLMDGLWKYQASTDSFTQFFNNLNSVGQKASNIRAIQEISNNRFWATTNNGLLLFSEEGEILKWINPENTKWLTEGRLEDIQLDINNNLVVATPIDGFYYLDNEGKLITHITTRKGNLNSLLSNTLETLFLDNDGAIWVGTRNDGISIWNNRISFIQKIEFEQQNIGGLSDGKIWGLYQDSKNRLWVGTDKGLDLWDKGKQKFVHYALGKMASEEANYVLDITETDDGFIWLSTGLGLMRFDPETANIKNFKTEKISTEGLFTDSIFDIFTDSKGRLWIGHNKGVSFVDKGKSKFVHINKESFKANNISSNQVGSFAENSFGDIWLGTSKGMCLYRYKFDNFDCLLKNYGGVTPKDTFLVSSLLIEKNYLWVGYSGNGLLKLDISNNEEKYEEFKSGIGIPRTNVSAILKDKFGRLWMSSQNGLIVHDPKDSTYTVIDAKDGLGDSEFNESSYTQLNDGRFAFGTVDGIVIVEPEKYKIEDKVSKIYLSGIYSLSDQKRISDIDNIELPEEKSGLKFEFSNLNFFYPEQSRYQYKSGKNKNWIDLANKSEILFAESKSGRHNIFIRSKYLGGQWGPEKIITFDVYPPLWRNNFFLALYVLLAIGSILFFMRYRQQQLIQKYKMLDVIKENEQQLRLSLDASEQGVWDWKTKNDFMTRSKTAELLHIEAPDTLVEYWALIEENDRLEVIQSWNSHLFGKQQNYHCQYRIKLDDEDIWIEEQGRAISRDKHGMAVHISGTYRNITHLKAIEKNLNLLAKAFEDTAEGMLVVDNDLNVVQVNNAVTEITGYPSDSLIGSSISARVSLVSPISFFDEVWQGVAEKGSWQGEVWQKNIDEEDIPLWLNVSEIKDKDQNDTYYVLIMSDMSERKATEEELRYLANYDTLTKLPNRALLRDRLDHALGNARRQHRPLALLFLDLDRFKNVNDSFGHAVGDGLLKIVSERLQECLREDDTVSRLGGDEFVILMEHFSSINAIAGVTEKIRIAMTHPFRLEGIDIQASFSIGVSVYPSDGEDSATLLRNADTAMYHAKSGGRNRVQFYAPKMNETALERLTLENDLRSAVGGGQLEVYYQPQVRSHDGSIYGAEALVRWNHPTRGLVMPNDFIPMAEESDLIVGLGNEVLYKACVQMQKWKEQFGMEIKISINLAARQLLQVDLARHIENVVNRAGLAPHLVCLEITETAVMEDLKRARKILETLRSKGFKIAIDDFGTGYSSLNYLRNIPLDIIKIDYSFVKELLNNSVDQAIVSAIIEIGAALDLQVLAEGIETPEQQKMLLDKGCEIFQGFFFGRPIPADEFTKYIEDSIAAIEAKKLKQKA